jgi:fructuronate reductase
VWVLSQVVTTVPDLGEGAEEYKLSLMARFSTTYVREQLQNLAQNGSIKLFNSMRGAILDLLEKSKAVDVLALALAGYSRYLMGTDESGHAITIKDPLTPTLYPLAWQVRVCP